MSDVNILPIEASRGVIEQAVQHHRVVVIQAQTGAGKSTRVPQYLLSCAERVIVTQPRRIAAASIAKRVAEEMEVPLGTLVGYRTATDAMVGPETRLLFCTDGIEVMRQFFDEHHEDTIVVIDEVHEWNLNLELLIAWFKFRMTQGQKIRLVIMSATIEAELLEAYFGDLEIISSKGRMFPVTELDAKGGVLRSVKMLLRQECNVLVFLPGKSDIDWLIGQLRKTEGIDAVILPLHAEVPRAEQELCFLEYEKPKCVVATNLAQTSITVPDINAVVDSGMERRQELVDGVEGLYLRPISLADRQQRKGRAGRVRPGMYIDCCPTPKAERRLFTRPAILMRSLEGLVLQLASVGLLPEDLEFFHKPWPANLERATKSLIALGCLTKDRAITPVGKLVSSIPLGVRYARMITETYTPHGHGGRVDDNVVTLAVLLEEGGVRTGRSDVWKQYAAPFPVGTSSDAYLELMAFEAATSIPHNKMRKSGIDILAAERIRAARQRVLTSLKSQGILTWRTRDNPLPRALAAGFADQVYKRSLGANVYIRISDQAAPRNLPKDSLVKDAEFIVGIPWNLQIRGGFGPVTKRYINAATEVDSRFAERLK